MTSLYSAEQYRALVLAGIPAPAPRALPLDEAFGCVLAADLSAPRDLPPFASSAMDGFAVAAADVSGAPVTLAIAGEVHIGSRSEAVAGAGQAVAVPTGGLVPRGADCIVPIEECSVEGGRVTINVASRPGRNLRPAGEDLRQGEILVRAARRLGPADLGAIAAAGFAEVHVYGKPRVAIFSTGDELVPPGGSAGPGQIFESNSHMLRGLVRRAGGDPVYAGWIPDDPGALLKALEEAPPADVVVCSGGVSAGTHDPVRRAFAAFDQVSCVRVAVQPGRPQAFGLWLGKPFFGLPGNPMASLVSFELFVRPALQRLIGLPPEVRYLSAVLDGKLDAAPEAMRYVPVEVIRQGPGLVARTTGRRRSNQLATLARAGGLVEVSAGSGLGPGDDCRLISIRED